jgi:transketolase
MKNSADNPFYRKNIINKLTKYMASNERYVLFVCDSGFGVIDELKNRFPERVHNVGIMEQGSIGIAAGMAQMGMIPIVYSIVNFLAFRSVEQIRNDIVLQNLNVKLIATGVNNYFKFLGQSHCCDEQDKTIMEMIGMSVFDPYENMPNEDDFDKLVNKWISSPTAGYFRV